MKAFVLAAGIAAISASAFISEAKADDVNPWKHCGVGAMVFDDNETAAAISNIIWDSGTTAITSATLSPGTCQSTEVDVANFIDVTYDVLVAETAQGQGQHVVTALNLVGCEASQRNIESLRQGLHHDVSKGNFEQTSHENKAYSYYQTLQQTAVACS